MQLLVSNHLEIFVNLTELRTLVPHVTGFICIWSYNKRLYRVLMMFIILYDNILNPGIYQI